MRLISQTFENSVQEDWTWQSDIFVSTDGTEQRVALVQVPRRSLAPTWQFNEPSAAGRSLRDLYRAADGVLVPAFQHATKISGAIAGATVIGLAAIRSELRDGGQAFIYNPRTEAYETVLIDTVTDSEVTLSEPLVNSWPAGCRIAPMWAFIVGDNANLSQSRMGQTNLSVTLQPLDYVDPFLNPSNGSVLDSFGGLPVITKRPTGDDFTVSYNTGATVNDYGAVVSIRNQWKHVVLGFARTFLCQRITNRADWQKWNKFADYCVGSINPFFMPTFTQDFDLVSATPTHLTLEGTDYNDAYFPFPSFKQVALFNAAGASFLSAISDCSVVAGNSVLSLNPALPDGFNPVMVSLLLKLRIADDKISCVHDPLQTAITINFRTCDDVEAAN